jgi:DnaJ-class molecular chaperone
MTSANQDPYSVLGVSRQASADEIKLAYRRLAQKHHPDRNPGDEHAVSRFKDIQTAFDRLKAPQPSTRSHPSGFGWEGPLSGATIDEIMASVFGFRQQYAQRARRQAIVLPLPAITLAQAFTGLDFNAEFSINVTCRTCSGRQDGCKTCSGSGLEAVSLQSTVHLQPGVSDGDRVEVQARCVDGSATPDAVILAQATVADDPSWDRMGADLVGSMEVSIDQLALGDDIQIDTPSGRLSVHIPPGSQPDLSLRIHGQGMPYTDGQVGRGDLRLRTILSMPKHWNKGQLHAWKLLREASREKSPPKSKR